MTIPTPPGSGAVGKLRNMLIWDRIVRERYPECLRAPCFQVAELIFEK